MTTLGESSPNIPPEIIEIILSKLSSVKSLLRFKTVSKSWNTIISDRVFVQNHLQSSKNSPTNLFIRMHKAADEKGFSLVKSEGTKFRAQGVLESPSGYNKILCECNGLLLLSYSPYKAYVLWNPSTRSKTYFQLPLNLHKEYDKWTYGICYDHIVDDFKVVFIMNSSRYAIYSSKNNSWAEKKGTEIYGGYTTSSGVFLDGATYWVLVSRDEKDRYKIVYFDPKTDELKTLQKPKELIGRNSGVHLRVDSWRDSLCLYCKKQDDKTKIRIWLKEKGVVLENPNWKELIITIDKLLPAPILSLQLLYFVGNKILIVIDEKRLFYCSPCEKTIEEFEEGDDKSLRGFVVPYVSSLFFPSGVKAIPQFLI